MFLSFQKVPPLVTGAGGLLDAYAPFTVATLTGDGVGNAPAVVTFEKDAVFAVRGAFFGCSDFDFAGGFCYSVGIHSLSLQDLDLSGGANFGRCAPFAYVLTIPLDLDTVKLTCTQVYVILWLWTWERGFYSENF